MSLHFLIDGYNVIKQADSLKDIPALKDARSALVGIIQAKRLMRSRNNQVTIIFDAGGNFNLYQSQNKGPVKIIFSKGDSADEEIKRMVRGCPNPKQIVVVTDDKEIIFFTRALGAKVMSVGDFLAGKQKQSDLKRGKGNTESLKIELTYQQQAAINQELRKIWK